MQNVKIVVVGIGSASFGPKTLGDIFGRPQLNGSEVWLVDINPEPLGFMQQLAARLNEEWACGMQLHTTTKLAEALPGSDFVICMLEANRHQLWQQDLMIPHKYGVMQVLGENGGPGGLAHTLRTAPLVLEVARLMDVHCPRAWLFNYTNPVPRICRAVEKYADTRIVGFCHGVAMTLRTAAQILDMEPAAIDIKAAGLNHFHWVLDIRSLADGTDLYDELRRREPEFEPGKRQLWRDLFRRLGHMPFTSDDHIGEYLAFMHVREFESWKKYGHDHWLLHWDGKETWHEDAWGHVHGLIGGEESIEPLRQGSGERAIDTLLAIRDNLNTRELALNIPNTGCITNLPEGCIVEVPATVGNFGVDGLNVGNLPTAIAGWCNTQVHVAELAVDAAITGDRGIALQSLLADPVINDIDVAEKILDDYLALNAEWLPHFSPA